MKTVGLTGGIGSGKSTVADFFIELGVPVYNSDKKARSLMKSSKKVKKAIVELLGKEAYEGKKLNKTYISNRIFNDQKLLEKMNDIVHPAVRSHFIDWKKKQKAPYVIQETALVFENETQDFYDKIILVVATESERIRRVMERDGISKRQVEERLKNQLTDHVKIPLAHYIIENADLCETQRNVKEVHIALLAYSR